MQGIWVDYKSFHGELRGFRSSCRRNEAAFGGEAVAKSDNGVRQLKPVLRIYDDYVAERSLVPSAAATSLLTDTEARENPPQQIIRAECPGNLTQ